MLLINTIRNNYSKEVVFIVILRFKMDIIEVGEDDMSPQFDSDAAKMQQDCILIQDCILLQTLPASYRSRFLLKMGYFLKLSKACLRTAETLFKCFHSLLLRFLTFFPIKVFFLGGGPNQGSTNGECHMLNRLHMISSSP